MGRADQTDSNRKGQGRPKSSAEWKQQVPKVDGSILAQARENRAKGIKAGETRGAADSRAMGD